ncbi:hypothetical protein JW960_21755 [candidate division KSB1 bacterium]|nr:hypothetical protein [candidate division KSB1 bacterium]
MKKYCLYFTCLFLIIFTYNIAAQPIVQENIAILPFSGWQGADAGSYQNALMDKITTRVIQSHRFNVIDRANLDKIFQEQGLHQTGAIDENTIVEVGKLLGANKFIVGNFSQSAVEFHKAEYDKNGKKTADAYYVAAITASIKLLDVGTGEYIEAAEAQGSSRGSSRRIALSEAIDEVTGHVVDAFFKYFAIQAYLQTVDQAYTIIDRGTDLGVKVGMNFEVLDISKQELDQGIKTAITSNTKRIGMLRIVSAEKNNARARLIGDYSRVRPGHLIREVKETVALEASIIKKSWGEVVINLGREVGVKRGTTFNVITKGDEFRDPATGEVYGAEEIKRGVIYVTSAQEKFARAKIIKGRYLIEQGMQLKETSRWQCGWKIGFDYSIAPAEGVANADSFHVTVDNKYTGEHEVYIDYRNKKDIETATLARLHFGYYDYVRDNDWLFGLGMAKFDDEINAFFFDFSYAHHFGIVPEFFYIYPGLGLGMAFAQQDAQDGMINALSDDKDDHVSAIGFEWMGTIGARLALGKFNLFGEMNYIGMNFKKWKYTVETGEKTTDDDGNKKDETEEITIENKYIPYPEVKLKGPSVKLGISFTF